MASPVSTEPRTLGEWLLWEVDEGQHRYCRDEAIVLAGSSAERTLTTGMVVGIVTATGQIAQVDDGASDGTEDAAGILITDSITAPDGTDQPGAVILVRGPAIIRASKLTWLASMDAGAQAAALAQIAALPGVILIR